jgi:hypothetical protein
MGHQYEAGEEADEGVTEARDGTVEAAERRDEKPGGRALFRTGNADSTEDSGR